ncbi:c2H2-type zinc-finger domain-containing protein [Ditylenchus destructor]|uniref:C2H2-type zinc-finger domain-containing protein n=1 Tax=Ditylenchus destructor TaxID=166010 RepID=A0AAD4MJT7_9BILA|nr:c2H2-type zinc-finger domain-containing protein [Ditylenchus destructor]
MEKPRKCSYCSYGSTNDSALKLHMLTHTGEKPYECDQCPYASNHAGSLKLHMRTHTGEKPYKCSQCPYSSIYSNSLKSHMRSHTGNKRFKCNQCSYTSDQAYSLKLHIPVHTDGKSYKCSQCPYSAMQPSTLRVHMRMHTGELLECNQCTYACTQKESLLKHMELHTGEYQALDALSAQTNAPYIEQPHTEQLMISSSMKATLVCVKCGQCDFRTIDDLETHIVLKHFRGIDALYKCLYLNCWALFPTEAARLKHARDVHLKAMSEVPMGILPQNQDKKFVSLRLAIQQCLNESVNVSFSNNSLTNNGSAMSKSPANANTSHFPISSTDSNVHTKKKCCDPRAPPVIKEENSVDPYENVKNVGKIENLNASVIKEEQT